jgi:hypothetical protein
VDHIAGTNLHHASTLVDHQAPAIVNLDGCPALHTAIWQVHLNLAPDGRAQAAIGVAKLPETMSSI